LNGYQHKVYNIDLKQIDVLFLYFVLNSLGTLIYYNMEWLILALIKRIEVKEQKWKSRGKIK